MPALLEQKLTFYIIFQEEKDESSKFEISVSDDFSGRWAFKSKTRGYFLGSNADALVCTAKVPNDSELWFVHLAVRPQVNLHSIGRKRFAHLSDVQVSIFLKYLQTGCLMANCLFLNPNYSELCFVHLAVNLHSIGCKSFAHLSDVQVRIFFILYRVSHGKFYNFFKNFLRFFNFFEGKIHI